MTSFGPPKDATSPGLPPAKAIPKTDWREKLLFLFFRRRRFRVEGHSMLPLLKPGDTVYIKVTHHPRDIPPGCTVLFRAPNHKLTLKKAHAWQPDGRLEVLGVNPSDSSDSRHFGPIAPGDIMGVVTSKHS